MSDTNTTIIPPVYTDAAGRPTIQLQGLTDATTDEAAGSCCGGGCCS
ncbi:MULTISPECIES: hypothetical protein [Cryobacterium]|nr:MULTISPECIES: hypothetical protein [Cryobacterium]